MLTQCSFPIHDPILSRLTALGKQYIVLPCLHFSATPRHEPTSGKVLYRFKIYKQGILTLRKGYLKGEWGVVIP